MTRIEAVVPERTKCAELSSLARLRRRMPGMPGARTGTFSTDESLSDGGIANYEAASLPIGNPSGRRLRLIYRDLVANPNQVEPRCRSNKTGRCSRGPLQAQLY
jgi:hypothetical protein